MQTIFGNNPWDKNTSGGIPGKSEDDRCGSRGKGVRLDVYVEDDWNTVFDLEMQIHMKRNLAKRMRYYQGMIDLNILEKGGDYNKLKKSYVIFICTFDLYGQGHHLHTFEYLCKQVNRDDRFMLNKRRGYCILTMKRYTETEGYIETIWV